MFHLIGYFYKRINYFTVSNQIAKVRPTVEIVGLLFVIKSMEVINVCLISLLWKL